MTVKELTTEWFERVWNNKEEEAIYELMCTDCHIKGLEPVVKGPDGFLAMHKTFFALFDNIHIRILEMVEEHGLVIGHANFTATHKQSGNPIDIVFSLSAQWKDGKISEAQNIVDYMTMFIQMGVVDSALVNKTLQA